MAEKESYLKDEVNELKKVWPDNHSFCIVCHGHSIPCGYTEGVVTRPFDAYPHLLHRELSIRFPYSVINVIVSAKGGENSVEGAKRFQTDVLNHKPDLVLIDYGRNDMFCSEEVMRQAWSDMIEQALMSGCKVLLITPAPDCGGIYYEEEKRMLSDDAMADVIRSLADAYDVGLADAKKVFDHKFRQGHSHNEYMVSVNHINKKGHAIVADCLLEWFPFIS